MTTQTKAPSALELIQQFFPQQIRLSTFQLSIILHCAEQSIRNDVAADKFKIKSYKDGRSRYFDIRDVGAYLDKLQGKVRSGPKTKESKIFAARAEVAATAAL